MWGVWVVLVVGGGRDVGGVGDGGVEKMGRKKGVGGGRGGSGWRVGII